VQVKIKQTIVYNSSEQACPVENLPEAAVGRIERGRFSGLYDVTDTFEPLRDSKSTAPTGKFTLSSPMTMIRSWVGHTIQ
jgi:hypothetical protein